MQIALWKIIYHFLQASKSGRRKTFTCTSDIETLENFSQQNLHENTDQDDAVSNSAIQGVLNRPLTAGMKFSINYL